MFIYYDVMLYDVIITKSNDITKSVMGVFTSQVQRSYVQIDVQQKTSEIEILTAQYNKIKTTVQSS